MPKKKVGTKGSSRSNNKSISCSNNLSIAASPSSPDKSGFSRGQSKSRLLKKSSSVTPKVLTAETWKNLDYEATVPKDAAVHFGRFYGLQGSATDSKVDSNPARFSRREFTRQTVKKLMQSVGTAEYARQVSELLEETVEPADFKLSPPPAENTIPDGRQNPSGYPLWYKEPHKPAATEENYRLLRERYEDLALGKKRIKALVGDDVETIGHYENYEHFGTAKSEDDLSTSGSSREHTVDSEGADLESLSNNKTVYDKKSDSV